MNGVHAWLAVAALCRGYAVAETDPDRRARWVLQARAHLLRARAERLYRVAERLERLARR